jgi:hypothetical protein
MSTDQPIKFIPHFVSLWYYICFSIFFKELAFIFLYPFELFYMLIKIKLFLKRPDHAFLYC